MSDFNEGVTPSDLIKEAEKSPSFSYNLAILESFQRSCRRASLPEGYKDDQREVIFFAGSYGKGVAGYRRDFDMVDLTESQRRNLDWLSRFTAHIEQEYNEVINDPNFYSGKRFAQVSLELERRIFKRYHRLRCQFPILDIELSVEMFSNGEKKYYKEETIGDKTTKIPITEEEFNRLFKVKMEAQTTLNSLTIDKESLKSAVAERASLILTTDNLPLPTYGVHGDYEPVFVTLEEIIYTIQRGVTNERYWPYHTIFLILSSTSGVNAYELTPGNLRYHQLEIIKALRTLHDSDKQKYEGLMSCLRKQWKDYIGRIQEKNPAFYREIIRSRGGKPYPLNRFFEFEEFPDINELEAFFK